MGRPFGVASDLLRLLEFDRVRELLAERCQFSLAAERARALGPTGDPDQVRYLLAVTREAAALLSEHPRFSVGGVRDIRPVLERAARGLLLGPTELRETLDTVQAARGLSRSFLALPGWAERYPRLAEFVLALPDLGRLEADLQRTVGPRGEILDSASERLAQIRRELKQAHDRLLERLRRMLVDPGLAPAIQEPIITMREGRYVIPVRSDRRSLVAGVTHDVSASGQTLFVEPLEVVELNNRRRELQLAEEHEVQRILRALTDQIAAEAGKLSLVLEAAAAVDLALAKARLAFDQRAVEPEILVAPGDPEAGDHPRHRVRLLQARHPLLDPATVVPIDVSLGVTYRILVITGPNTGGKTVALKTVGLLVLMAQSGLFIPAAEGSGLSVFPAVFAYIGDEQSIEQNLSTFSSHLTRIIAALRSADSDSLVLLDELAAGTDPQEGSALARAILSRLLELGVLGVVTTHYPELKAFAYTTPGLENASVEFDVRTLAPTYRLVTGVAGRSNALVIARRLGLDESVIEEARRYLDPSTARVEDMLAEIRRRLEAAGKELDEAHRARAAAQALLHEAEEQRQAAELERSRAREEARAEVEAELVEARELLRQLRRLASQEDRPSQADLEQAARVLEAVRRSLRAAARRSRPVTPALQLQVGDRVEVPSLGLHGELVGLHAGDEAEIQIGSFRVRQPLSLLRKAGDAIEPGFARPLAVSAPPPPHVEPELHLRGLRAAAALQRLERYLDDAARAGLPWVRIVHGKGTGALRAVVQEALRQHPLVERFERAGLGEGGEGATLVYLKG
jgi:DNA mismatch repair protein MutS2